MKTLVVLSFLFAACGSITPNAVTTETGTGGTTGTVDTGAQDMCYVPPTSVIGFGDCKATKNGTPCAVFCGQNPEDGGTGTLLPVGCTEKIPTDRTWTTYLCVASCAECVPNDSPDASKTVVKPISDAGVDAGPPVTDSGTQITADAGAPDSGVHCERNGVCCPTGSSPFYGSDGGFTGICCPFGTFVAGGQCVKYLCVPSNTQYCPVGAYLTPSPAGANCVDGLACCPTIGGC